VAEVTKDVPASTRDTLFGGRVALAQPVRGRGYRVNIDAVLLGAFAAGALGEPRRARRAHAAFDVGSGVGAVALTLLHLDAAAHVTLLEVDAGLAQLAGENAIANGWSDRIEVVRGDVSDASIVPAGAADLVVCNPPYVEPGRGRAPSAAHARARSGPLAVFLDAARRLAGRRARICLIYPAIEATTLLVELRARGLEPKRLRPVHGRANDQARVVLVECATGRPGGLVVEPPLVETSPDAPAILFKRG
jgi:tRNA1Val (adenine37-N6)-methyltransferase